MKKSTFLSTINFVLLLLLGSTSLFAQENPGGVAGADLWLKADDNGGVTTDGTAITTWTDQSLGTNNGANVGAPTYQDDAANQINFNPTVSLNGTTDGFDLPNGTLSINDDNYSYYTVFKKPLNNDNEILFFSGINNINNWIITYVQSDGGVDDRFNSTGINNGPAGAVLADTPALVSFNYNTTANTKTTYVSGDQYSQLTSVADKNTVNNNHAVGYNGMGGSFLQGNLAEMIAFDVSHSAAERQQIESYLAIKYGITLEASAGNYVNSSGTSVYDVSSYNNDIFGIAKDDAQGLDQQISKSVNTGAILTLSNDTNFTTANGTHVSLTDGQFLVLGSNGLTTGIQTTEIGEDIISGINREWKVQNTGGVGAVNLKFDGFDDEYTVLTSTTGDFSTGATALGKLNAAGELTGVTLANNTFITLAIGKAPGAVTDGLALWLKADAGATAAQWNDQSGNANHAVQATAANQPNITASVMNFNPGISFSGDQGLATSDYYSTSNTLSLSDNASIFTVTTRPVQNNTSTATSFRSVFASRENWANTSVANGYWLGYGRDNREARGNGISAGVVNQINGTAAANTGGFINSLINTNRSLALFGNGAAEGTKTTNANTTGTALIYEIGENSINTAGGFPRAFTGEITEIIAYNQALNAADAQKVQSYLAIKYGITLEASAGNYVNSSGTSVYDVSSYNNDIFGIAKDDAQGLDQQISKSINSGSILTLSNDTNFTTANGTHVSLTDGQFLMLGSNGLTTGIQTTEIGEDIISGINREWKVQNTGGVGNVNLKFDGFDSNYIVLTSTTGDFSTGATSLGRLNAAGELTGVTLANNTFITLAIGEAPGAVQANLALWLKADVGVIGGATVTQWDDQSGNNHSFTASGTESPDATNGTINFNQSLYFDGSSDILTNTTTAYGQGTITDASFFGVYTIEQDKSTAFGGSESNRHTRLTHTTSFSSGDADSNGATNRIVGAGIPVSDYGTPYLFGFNHQTTGGALQQITQNGIIIGTDTGATTFIAPTTSYIGSSQGASERLKGNVSEIIAYPTKLSNTEIQQIQSYLAIKYGITLDNGATAYLDAAGTTVWPVDTDYASDIFGIAKDDAQGLDQQISKSVNTGAILTLSNDTNFTTVNGTHASLINGQFLVIGNDGASGAVADAISTDLDTATYFTRAAREWKAVNTGTIAGNVNLQFDGYDNTWVLLTRTTDGDFSATTGTTETALTASGTVSLALPGTTYFTLAQKTTSIEFELATANDDENTGANLPNLIINGTLNEATDIDILVNATSTATPGVDFTFGGLTAAGTVTATIPAGTYSSGTPIALSSLNISGGASVAFAISNDAITEANETIAMSLSNAQSGLVIQNSIGTALIDDHVYTITDDDDAGFTLTPLTLTVNEDGGTGTFTVVLDAEPPADVTFNISSTDANEATVDLSQITFTNANWNTAQTITVTGVDDTTFTTDNVAITVAVNDTLSDDAFDSLADQTVNVTLSNEDIVIGPSISTAMLSIDENGGTETFTIVLGSQPTNDVILNITSADINEATVDFSQITFTNANWNVAQTITVTAIDDTNLTGDTTTIDIEIDASSDAFFTTLPNQEVNLTLINDDISTNGSGTTLSGDDSAAIANGTDTENIMAQLKGDDGVDIKRAGINVTFAVTGSATLSSLTATTDANGTATVSITNTIAETVNVTATVDVDNDGGTTPEVAITNGSPVQVTFMVDSTSTDILTQIGNEGDDPDTVNSIVTVVQLTMINGITGVVPTNEIHYQNYIDENPDLFSAPATVAEVQAMIDAVNALVIISEGILTQIGNEADEPDTVTSVVTVAELATILPAVTGLVTANETAYQEYIDANPNEFDAPATQPQVQAMIDAVNTSQNILEQIGNEGDDPDSVPSAVTTTELEMITGITGVDSENESEYQEYIDAHPELFSAPSTVAEVQAMIDAVNAAQSLLAAIGIDEDDATATTTNATADQLNAIVGVSGAIAANESAYQEYINANEGNFSSPATAAEVQIMIDAVNTSQNILEQIGNEGDDPDSVPSAVTTAELEMITGITGVDSENESEYQEYIDAHPELFSAPATAAEVQIMIDAVNTSENVLAQIGNEGDDPDTVLSEVTIAQLESITGITGVNPENETAYQEYIDANPELFSSPATVEEVQAMIDIVNDIENRTNILAEILEDSNSTDGEDNDNGTSVTVDQLEEITELVNIIPGNEEAYQIAINNETGFSNPPTIEEIQELIDAVNRLIELIDNADDPADGNPSISELSDIGIVDLDPLRGDLYEEAIANANPQPQSLDELQAIIDQVNSTPLSVVSAQAFTPNGDGINDTWVIDGILDHPNNLVKVYNRNGHEVFSARGYQNNWNAIYRDNSDKLPPGSYYYVIDLNDGSTPRDGWIFINY